MKWDALRIGQSQAVKTVTSRVLQGELWTAIVLPTRYGKSDVMRVATLLLWLDGHIGCALALSPNVTLRDQLGNAKKWNETLTRYEIKHHPKIRTLNSLEVDPCTNGEVFLSVTMQLVERNIDLFRQWVESVFHRTGKPVLMRYNQKLWIGI